MSSEHDLDAHLQLRTDEDHLVGTLLIGPKAPASEITPHVLAVFLQSRGVADRLIDHDALKQLAEGFRESPGSEQAAEVCRGKPPRHGSPRTLEWNEAITARIDEIEARSGDPEQPPAQPEASESSDDAVDHYGHSAFIVVGSGDELGTISPPDPGEDGEDIYGEVIPAKQSPTPGYIDTETLDLTEDNKVNARNAGHLVYSGSTRKVAKTLDIQGDVGFGTGHVDFPGPVIVQGGVKDRFQIHAAGDITVRKLVEAANIFSQRDISLERGVAGRELASIDASRDIHAGYLESADATAFRDCCVQREITNCTVTARGGVRIEHGAIRGGTVTAGKHIEAGVLGSAQEVPTEITVGSIPELDHPLASIRAIRDTADERRAELTLKLESIRSAMDTGNPDAIEKTMGLEFEINELGARIRKLDNAADRLRGNLREHTDATLIVHKRIHPGVVVRMRGHAVRFKDEFAGPFTLRVDRAGELIIDQHGNERPASEVAAVEPDNRLDPLIVPEHPELSGDASLGSGLVSDEGQQAA